MGKVGRMAVLMDSPSVKKGGGGRGERRGGVMADGAHVKIKGGEARHIAGVESPSR